MPEMPYPARARGKIERKVRAVYPAPARFAGVCNVWIGKFCGGGTQRHNTAPRLRLGGRPSALPSSVSELASRNQSLRSVEKRARVAGSLRRSSGPRFEAYKPLTSSSVLAEFICRKQHRVDRNCQQLPNA